MTYTRGHLSVFLRIGCGFGLGGSTGGSRSVGTYLAGEGRRNQSLQHFASGFLMQRSIKNLLERMFHNEP
jgi:hypothetical protein